MTPDAGNAALVLPESEWVDYFAFHVSRYGNQADAVRVLEPKVGRPVALAMKLAFQEQAKQVQGFDTDGAVIDRQLESWYIPPTPPGARYAAFESTLAQKLPAEVVAKVGTAADRILGSCGNPTLSDFTRRGLVLGYVQSGKTTSFMALAAKAADVGYKLVIVLSGLTDNLRQQTQDRIDSSSFGDGQLWRSLTTIDHDFQAYWKADQDLVGEKPAYAVVKKNPARLRRLRDWLRTASPQVERTSPILIIDDEADQATPNSAKARNRLTTINRLLREIANEHTKVTYVAYTATPFANLLMHAKDGEELYPKDFIISLDEPDGYFGTRAMFGSPSANDEEAELDLVRTIDVGEAEAVRDTSRPASLEHSAFEAAVRWFVLATSARRAREAESRHSTMLINVSTLASDHFATASVAQECIALLRERFLDEDPALLDELEAQWNQESSHRLAGRFGHRQQPFEELLATLGEVLDAVRVVVDNYKSVDRLSYGPEAQTVVVVGGNTMSRGLTLEGLTSSYFLRTTKTYDSLLQMGRWFGYRGGYEDLPRVWMPDAAFEWFRHLSLVELEIRDEIRKYGRGEVRPIDAAVRIRLHPQMDVVASNRNRGKKVSVSYSGSLIQTTVFPTSHAPTLRNNLAAVSKLVKRLGKPAADLSPLGYRDVDVADVIDFLNEYQTVPDARVFVPDRIVKYIRQENESTLDRSEGLHRWNIVFAHGSSKRSTELDGVASFPFVRRSSRVPAGTATDANVGVLTSGGDRLLDVNPSSVPDEYKVQGANAPSDADLRDWKTENSIVNGLLVIYMIDKCSKKPPNSVHRHDLDAPEDVVGLAVFFPPAVGLDSLVEYIAADLPDPGDGLVDDDDIDGAEKEILDADLIDVEALDETRK